MPNHVHVFIETTQLLEVQRKLGRDFSMNKRGIPVPFSPPLRHSFPDPDTEEVNLGFEFLEAARVRVFSKLSDAPEKPSLSRVTPTNKNLLLLEALAESYPHVCGVHGRPAVDEASIAELSPGRKQISFPIGWPSWSACIVRGSEQLPDRAAPGDRHWHGSIWPEG